jgi:hypothetical protein
MLLDVSAPNSAGNHATARAEHTTTATFYAAHPGAAPRGAHRTALRRIAAASRRLLYDVAAHFGAGYSTYALASGSTGQRIDTPFRAIGSRDDVFGDMFGKRHASRSLSQISLAIRSGRAGTASPGHTGLGLLEGAINFVLDIAGTPHRQSQKAM